MTDNKKNIIESMLLGTAIKEVRKARYNTAAKVLMVLVTEFNYQVAVLASLRQEFDDQVKKCRFFVHPRLQEETRERAGEVESKIKDALREKLNLRV